MSRVELRLANPVRDQLDEVTQALVDTGAIHLCFPESLRRKLKLEGATTRPVRIATGEAIDIPYVGPVKIGPMGREVFTGAMVMSNEVRLGGIPLKDVDLHPAKGGLIPKPDSSDWPMSLAMGILPTSGAAE